MNFDELLIMRYRLTSGHIEKSSILSCGGGNKILDLEGERSCIDDLRLGCGQNTEEDGPFHVIKDKGIIMF